jgi:hypothetical protein
MMVGIATSIGFTVSLFFVTAAFSEGAARCARRPCP